MDSISKILYKRLTGETLTESETSELEAWIAESRYNREVAERLADPNYLEKEYRLQSIVESAKAYADMRRRIDSLPSVRFRTVLKMAAAAAVLVIGATVGYHLLNEDPDLTVPENYSDAGQKHEVTIDDFKHGQMIARLTDETGNTRTLHGATVPVPAADSMMPKVIKQRIEDLKLEVPRGGEFKVMLEDSTEVWLNSESTLRYPEVFGDDERRVEVTGEAYFSVRKDEKRPFYVVSGGQKIRVYGTTFNVRGYADDRTICTTLETGQIALSRLDGVGGELRLSPGHQAVFDKGAMKVSLMVVNPTIVTSWRHGKFVFDEQPLSAIMQDLARWYNFDYEFSDPEIASMVFKGTIPRYGDLRQAISILEMSGGIEFSVENDIVKIGRKKSV